MAVAELFRALGEPTRLEMVRRLSSADPHTIATLTNGLGISRQGARKHLQVLSDAHVVTLERQGRDTAVHLERDSLEVAKAFIAQLEHQWDLRLESLRSYLEDEQPDRG